MRTVLVIVLLLFIVGYNQLTITVGKSISDEKLEQFFRKHQVDGNFAVALKKKSLDVTSYLATIHGYPNNLSVCNDLIAQYNKDTSLSAMQGTYFCEELR